MHHIIEIKIFCAPKNLWKSFSFIEDGCAIDLLDVEALSPLTVSTYNDCESKIFSLIFISYHFKPISVNFGLELFLLDAGTLEQRLTCEINYCLGSTDNNGDFTPDNVDCIPLATSCVKTSSSFQWSLLWWIYKNPFRLNFFGVLIKKDDVKMLIVSILFSQLINVVLIMRPLMEVLFIYVTVFKISGIE